MDPAVASRPLAGKTVVLDPGHAVLSDSGVILNPGTRARRGAYERDVALKVTEKLTTLLEAQGARVFRTRTQDNPWRYSWSKAGDNKARAIFANVLRGDAYVRIHCDWNRDRRFRGFTTYYYRWGSRTMAKQIHRAMMRGLPDRLEHGVHRRSFVSATAEMPAVLIEIGVMSHRKEGKELATEAYQARAAQAITDGIVDYFDKREG